jgi:hypothetical protein
VNEPKDWPHIRCKLSCEIGRDALDGKGLDATASDQMTFSIYSLLGAVADLSEQVAELKAQINKQKETK